MECFYFHPTISLEFQVLQKLTLFLNKSLLEEKVDFCKTWNAKLMVGWN